MPPLAQQKLMSHPRALPLFRPLFCVYFHNIGDLYLLVLNYEKQTNENGKTFSISRPQLFPHFEVLEASISLMATLARQNHLTLTPIALITMKAAIPPSFRLSTYTRVGGKW